MQFHPQGRIIAFGASMQLTYTKFGRYHSRLPSWKFMTDMIPYTSIVASGLVAVNRTNTSRQTPTPSYKNMLRSTGIHQNTRNFHHIYFRLLITPTITCEGPVNCIRIYLLDITLPSLNPSSLLEAKRVVEIRKVCPESLLELSFSNPGKRVQNSLPQRSSWRHSEMLAHSLIPMPLVLENIQK